MNTYLFTINIDDSMILQQIITAANRYQAEEIIKSEYEPLYGDIKYVLIDIKKGNKNEDSD